MVVKRSSRDSGIIIYTLLISTLRRPIYRHVYLPRAQRVGYGIES